MRKITIEIDQSEREYVVYIIDEDIEYIKLCAPMEYIEAEAKKRGIAAVDYLKEIAEAEVHGR